MRPAGRKMTSKEFSIVGKRKSYILYDSRIARVGRIGRRAFDRHPRYPRLGPTVRLAYQDGWSGMYVSWMIRLL